jgi:uncharacterized delta-60 repeat protein
MRCLIPTVSCLFLATLTSACGGSEGSGNGDTGGSTDGSGPTGAPTDAGTDNDSGDTGGDGGGSGDDGSTEPGPECGNGVIEGIEECDDGNQIDGDGCNADCTLSEDTMLWEHTHGGDANIAESGQGVAVDSAGNVLVAGYVINELENPDIFVRKYDPDGTELWTQIVDGDAAGDDRAYGIAADADDNVWVVGDNFVADNDLDMWIAKFDGAGTALWSFLVPGPVGETDTALDVTVDEGGNAAVVGFSRAATNDYDIWVGRYDPDGTELWTDLVPGAGVDDRGVGVTVDADGNIVAIGYVSAQDGRTDVWLRKYDPDGGEVWTQLWESLGGGNDRGHDVAASVDGFLVVTGYTPGGGANLDVWIARLTGEGEVVWFQNYGSPNLLDDHGNGIALDSEGNIVVAGFKSVTDKNRDIWMRKQNAETTQVVWTQVVIGDGGDRDQALDVAIDADDNVLVTGEIREAESNGDIWVAKFGP